MKKTLLSLFTFAAFSVNAQNVVFTNADFKDSFVKNFSINTNHDNEIQLSEAQNFKGSIQVSSTDVTGLEEFTGLTELKCFGAITNIDLSKMTLLTRVEISNSSLTQLDLRKNASLTAVYLSNNNMLTTICVAKSQEILTANWTKDSQSEYSVNCVITALEASTFVPQKTLVNTYNLQGNVAHKNETGILIQVFSDGTRTKIFVP